MIKINYITNIARTEVSGGGSGINNAVCFQLEKFADVRYIGPINPRPSIIDTYYSRFRRAIGLRGNYFFFSNHRLKNIAREVNIKINPSADANFFHHTTSWIQFKSELPYYAYSDACFATYVKIFNDASRFDKKDLHRIYDLEADWMGRAKRILFRSHWALKETIKSYSISDSNLEVINFGGFIDIPKTDQYKKGGNFLFIAKEFFSKGGSIVVKAFEKLLNIYPEITLTIIGEKPPMEYLSCKSVIYAGFLRKEVPDERHIFIDLLKNAFALVHPTKKDTNTLVVIECGYYGCPAIASRAFAIPEIIDHEVNGILLDDPNNVVEVFNKMRWLIEHPSEYAQMRRNTRIHKLENYSWDKVGEKLKHILLS